jgi:hypothetical protein
LIVNAGLLVFQLFMAKGLEVQIPLTIVSTVGTVFVEILLLVANIITFKALDSGSAAFFGHRLASPHGYSLAVCGFQHSAAVFKSSFCSDLSLNSSCRKLLGRIAIVWFILESLKNWICSPRRLLSSLC